MRRIVLLCTALFTVTLAFAQPTDKKISKVTFEMVDGDYQDAAFKATKLLEAPEYRKNGWLWYYKAQSYFEIAKKAELSEDYPNAFKESLKAAYKLNKYKDANEENVEVFGEAKEFLTALKDSAITLSEIYYDNENPRKAAYYLKKVMKFDDDDRAVMLMTGVYQIKSRNMGEGIKSCMAAMDGLDAAYQPDEVSAQTMVDALDEYALIIKSGEYDKYFSAYKFEPTSSDVNAALALKEEFKKYIIGEEVDKEERKAESEVIYKSFKSDDKEEGDEDEE